MVIRRKPPKAVIDKVDEFISEATVAETKAEDKTEGRNRPQKEVGPRADFEEQISHRRQFPDNFKRESFYVHKDLMKALRKRIAGGSKGEKTKIINRALQMYFESYEPSK